MDVSRIRAACIIGVAIKDALPGASLVIKNIGILCSKIPCSNPRKRISSPIGALATI